MVIKRYYNLLTFYSFTDKMNYLSDSDIVEIKTTWRIPMENPTESGQAILLKFFERYPSNLQKFKDFKGMSIEELKVDTHIYE